MKIALILLDQQDRYVDSNGNLPSRPAFDKKLLTKVVSGQSVSINGYNTLPPSIQKLVTISNKDAFPITIPEIGAADMLIISRSMKSMEDGKVFRLGEFERLVVQGAIEIWVRIK